MSALQFFQDDLLLEIGRIAALRGSLRLALLSAADALLSTRLGDRGIARLMMLERELPAICDALIMLAKVRGVAHESVQQLVNSTSEFRGDFELSAAIANGTWTHLGGDQERWYGLFLGEAEHDGSLAPRWKEITIADLRGLTQRLERASEALKPLKWAALAAGAQVENMQRSP